jgi:TonB family protein
MTASQNPAKNTDRSPRSNPACLEINVTLQSLPAEAGGSSQSIREEGKTVIVFDNGAVLRIANNLPIGQRVLLSNPNGREAVCRIVSGRNLPNVKGYVEVEFAEPVKDFWGVRQVQNTNPVSVPVAAPTVTPPAVRETQVPPPSMPPRAVVPSDAVAQASTASSGRGPSFEDIPGLLSTPVSTATREPKIQVVRPSAEKMPKVDSEYSRFQAAQSSSVTSWSPQNSEWHTEKPAFPATKETTPATSMGSTRSRDIFGNSLMADEQPRSSSGGSSVRSLFIAGVLALAVAGICGGVFFMRLRSASGPVAKTGNVSQPSIPEPPMAKSATVADQAAQGGLAQGAAQTLDQARTQVQPVSVDQPQSIAAVPAVLTAPASTDSWKNTPNTRQLQENATVAKQPNPSSSRRPMIPNLKMTSPSAPIRNAANPGDGSAPISEIASTEAVGATPPAGLLTSSGRTNNSPAPPPFAPAPAPAPVAAPRTAREPKLISSTRLVYPTAARQSHIEGSVTVSANIDENGKVVGAKAVSGPMLLRQAAVDSVTEWKYSPGLIDGKPAPSQVTVSVAFRLN